MAINNYFNQLIKWSSQSGVDLHGDHSFSAPVDIYGRIQLKKEIARDDNGEDIVADATAYIAAGVSLKTHDKITYEDSNGDERNFEVLDVYEAQGRAALHHKRALLAYRDV